MVNGIQFCKDLEKHFFDLALSDAIFELKMKRFIAVDDRSLKKGLWKLKEGFAAVLNFNSFLFFFMFWRRKNYVLLIFWNLPHDVQPFPVRFFHLFCNLLKGITFWLDLNELRPLGQQLMCHKFTFNWIWYFGLTCWITLGINWSVNFRIRLL